jgi:hypothetical protein
MVIELKHGCNNDKLAEITNKLINKKHRNNLKRWSGIIRLKKEPLSIQKQMRDEWK